MDRSMAKKVAQLGQPFGTASGRLRKMVLFSLLQEVSRDVCHQCSRKIEAAEHLSIEHKEPWLDSENPVEKFFALSNIAFSHLSCNIGAARQPNRRVFASDEERVEFKRAGWRARNARWQTPEKRRLKYLRSGH